MANVANYVQVAETLIDHPKTTRAMRALRINRMQVVGHLVAMWNWALKNAPDGDLSRFSVRDISDAARFTDPDDFEEEADGAARRFVEALQECRTSESGHGFLGVVDGRLVIHDWQEYGGKLLAKREDNAQRKRQQRAGEQPEASSSTSGHADVTRTSRGRTTGLLKERRGEERREEKTETTDHGAKPPREGSSGRSASGRSDASGRRRPDLDIDKVLAEADSDPARSNWRPWLDWHQARVRPDNPAAWRQAVVANWERGDGAPEPGSSPPRPGLKLSPKEQAAAERCAHVDQVFGLLDFDSLEMIAEREARAPRMLQ